MTKHNKNNNKELRELVNTAYEREVNNQLLTFSKNIDEWRNGQLEATELISLIHEFDIGSSKVLLDMYESTEPKVLIARAIVEQLLTEEEISKELLCRLRNAIEYYKLNSPPSRPEIPEDLFQ